MTVATQAHGYVVDMSISANAALRPVAVDAVSINDAFWAPRMRANIKTTIPSQYRQLLTTGRIDNLLRVAGKFDGPHVGRYFNDSDVYKWIEAASWALFAGPNDEIAQAIEDAIDAIEGAQRKDGYLNSYFELERADERWTDHDLHEMYCAGHLFQAAVAHKRATGSNRLIDISVKLADHIDSVFGPEEEGKRIGTDGHPEVEMGLVELARETGEVRYLKLAQFLVDVRGHGVLGNAYDRFGRKYHQDHEPIREMDEIVGHAVRAVYLNAGVADIAAETGEPALLDALHRLWDNMTGKKMYASGGVGSRYEGEAFGENYELPNLLAYTETCAAIGSLMWTWRMLLIEGQARYADLIELQLYNAMLSGVSLDGETYFYQNPLADEGNHRRAPWFKTACCPPNVARTLASLPGYVYSTKDDEIWVHLYIANSASITLGNGRGVNLSQQTNYPWDGDVRLRVETDGDFAIRLRIPGWCESGAELNLNGAPIESQFEPSSYVEVRRVWTAGDVIDLHLPMPIRPIQSHPYVEENTGRIALMRGPLLYCIEQADNAGIDVHDVKLAPDTQFTDSFRPDLLGGVVAVTANAAEVPVGDDWNGRLYRSFRSDLVSGDATPKSITAIPYFSWANREPGPMRVWIPVE